MFNVICERIENCDLEPVDYGTADVAQFEHFPPGGFRRRREATLLSEVSSRDKSPTRAKNNDEGISIRNKKLGLLPVGRPRTGQKPIDPAANDHDGKDSSTASRYGRHQPEKGQQK